MKRLIFSVFVIITFAVTANAQVPNPKGLNGSFVTSGASDHSYIISLRQLTNSGSERRVRFISNFTVSDSCRVVINNPNIENKMKTPADSDISKEAGKNSYDYAVKYVPLAANTPYNFACDSEYITIYAYGDARSVSYKGTLEYHE